MAHPMSDGDWRLSFDAVSSVMAASPPPTISALMQSCHALYAEGPRHLLRDGVGLHSEIQVIQFTNFMLTRDPSRLALLRKLELAFSFPFPLLFSDGTRQRLGQLLLHPALALETFILRGAALVLSRSSLSDTILCSAFGRLNTLKHLVLHGVGAESGPVIQALPSKLESAAISVDRPLIEGPMWARFDMLSALRPFAGTLRTMLVKLQPSSPALSLLTNGGSYSFPHVQTFGIVYDHSTLALLESPAFAQTFPALTHLQLIPPTPDRHARRRRNRLETASRLREGSQGWRAQNARGSAFPALASLAECSGRLFDVYSLALDEPLATLRLWQHVVPGDLPVLRAVLKETRPGRLCLSMEVDSPQAAHSGSKATFAALRALLAEPPRRVDLALALSPGFWGSLYVEGALPRFLRLFGELVVEPPLPPELAELNIFVEPPPDAHPVVRGLFGDGLAVVAKWVAGAVPALRFSCRIVVDSGDPDGQWPDLGQDEARENPFSMLNTFFDDDDDDDDFDDGDEDEN
ncbi:hypothetical protein GSI_05012 [Ganoderma sinense ZZ0214-1]|uniref:F-box domain-containing protein n=1 Tax=Ganoderma sinense ZZ0214-1 TaxID=1077348 RepID=A0A2G8SGJ8_9APHY|nr:hypothetical protein GSI_05012 [Ganoderma sinense ZZ0214-1]